LINGHAHNYRRFARRPNGKFGRGQLAFALFVVGTGGESLMSFGTTIAPTAKSGTADSRRHPISLYTPPSYDWQFIPLQPNLHGLRHASLH